MLQIQCQKHPKYTGERRSRRCETCHLLYILRWQHDPNAASKLGGLNPYQFIDENMDDVCMNLKVNKILMYVPDFSKL
jgi:hypothetical protein